MNLRSMAQTALPSDVELRRIRTSWPGGGWTWDGRNNCVASSFSIHAKNDYETILAAVFPNRWEHRTIAGAPTALQDVVESTGGMRQGQSIYTPAESRAAFGYALWWPWGDDATISVRLALSNGSQSALEALRDLFGAEL